MFEFCPKALGMRPQQHNMWDPTVEWGFQNYVNDIGKIFCSPKHLMVLLPWEVQVLQAQFENHNIAGIFHTEQTRKKQNQAGVICLCRA